MNIKGEHSSVPGAVSLAASEVFLRQGGQFIVIMVLAHLVAPAAFGLVAILASFSAIASVFVQGGFPSALIQKENISSADMSTAFWINVGAATILALFFILLAPWIARFFENPVLKTLTWAMALNIWLTGWQTVHRALMIRDFRFRAQLIATAWATVLSGVLAILAALNGAGVWALVLHLLGGTLVTGLFLWHLHEWRPSPIFSWESCRNLFSFGFFMALSTMVGTLGNRFYTLLIGYMYPVSDLGQFHQAMTTRGLPQGLLGTIFRRVAFPLFAARLRENGDATSSMRSTLRASVAVNSPIMLGIAASAGSLVPTIFGTQWLPTIPLLQILCLAGLLWPLQAVNITALAALGLSKQVFRLELTKKCVLILAATMASPWGMESIAWSMVAASCFNFLLNGYFTSKQISYSITRQIFDVLPYFLLATVMSVLVWIVDLEMQNQLAPYRLLVDIVVGASFYLAAGKVFHLQAFQDAAMLIRRSVLSGEQQVRVVDYDQ